MKRLAAQIEDPNTDLPVLVKDLSMVIVGQIDIVQQKIAQIEKRLRDEARGDAATVRLQTAPGIGPISAMAIKAFAPAMQTFRRGRDFAAWLGLVPRQHSTGGRQKLGRVSKMGQRDIRRLLVIGAMSRIRWAERPGRQKDPWLNQMLARKPKMLVAIALANKMARTVWAMLTKEENYKTPAALA